jgi:hypothetical protein
MRLHGISFLAAVLSVFIFTPRPATADAIIQTVSAATDETTPDTINAFLSDIVAEPSAPLFPIPGNVTPFNLEPFDGSDEGFLSPELLSLEPGSFPAQHLGTQEILHAAPEPSSAAWLTSSLLTIAWLGLRKRQRFKL